MFQVMAAMHLVNWSVRTTGSHSTVNLTSQRFAPLGGIRVSGPVQDGRKTSRSVRLVVRAQGSKKGGNSGDKARRCMRQPTSIYCFLIHVTVN